MTVTAAAPATTGTSLTSSGATRAPTKTFDSQMFLNLLVTQLRNQDPSSPMDSTQMVEQLTSLTKTTTDGYTLQMRSTAANILGKSVSYTDADGVARSGIATAVSFAGGTPTITVGSATVSLTDLTGLSTASS